MDDVFSGMADASTGLRRLPALGNAQKRLSWSLKNSKGSPYYYWSVQAIDTAYAGSAWASEQTAIGDGVPPVISSSVATPPMVAAGDPVHVLVNVTDNSYVASVTAEGSPLTKKDATSWEGDIPASAIPDTHAVTVVAVDSIGNSTTDALAFYKTAEVVGASCGSAKTTVTSLARGKYLFKFWGKVTIDTDGFLLDDGSPSMIKVLAPEYSGITDGDFASARGILDPSTTPPTLTCPAAVVKKLK